MKQIKLTAMLVSDSDVCLILNMSAGLLVCPDGMNL